MTRDIIKEALQRTKIQKIGTVISGFKIPTSKVHEDISCRSSKTATFDLQLRL
jgi:hypothetical protein